MKLYRIVLVVDFQLTIKPFSVSWSCYGIFLLLVVHFSPRSTVPTKRSSQGKLAKFLTTIFHLSFSFVLIMTQRPASGGSALMGYGGRCTARIASEESKKSSAT